MSLAAIVVWIASLPGRAATSTTLGAALLLAGTRPDLLQTSLIVIALPSQISRRVPGPACLRYLSTLGRASRLLSLAQRPFFIYTFHSSLPTSHLLSRPTHSSSSPTSPLDSPCPPRHPSFLDSPYHHHLIPTLSLCHDPFLLHACSVSGLSFLCHHPYIHISILPPP